MKNCFVLTLFLVLNSLAVTRSYAQMKIGDHFPLWTPDHLDIHHISTGKGESIFVLGPDGTTMLIDAGETGTDANNFKPNATRSAGEWIARYVSHMMQPLPEVRLDYILLTHFHDDHMGDVRLTDVRSSKGDYLVTGISEVGDLIPFKKIVDRQWPDYNYPNPLLDQANMQNYHRFIQTHLKAGAKAERFDVGSKDQFTLLYQPEKYPLFEIRNLAANGEVWTGTHNNTKQHFPELEDLDPREYPGENSLSTALRISYGDFDYFTGGDLLHEYAPGTWKDIETAVGFATGKVEVAEANHHGKDAMGTGFLRAVQPRVIVLQSFALSHPDAIALRNMLNKEIYPDERDVFLTHMFDVNRAVLGEELVSQLSAESGHIVIRVLPGGTSYYVYVLDDRNEEFIIKSIQGPYESK